MNTKQEKMLELMEDEFVKSFRRRPAHIKEKEFNSKLVDIAKKYEIPDFKIIYGNHRCFGWQCADIIEHDHSIEKFSLNGKTVEARLDFADHNKLEKYRSEVKDLAEIYEYKKFILIYDGFREFRVNLELKNKKVPKL